jgi:hypothetical protein
MDTLAVLKQQPDYDWTRNSLCNESGQHCGIGWILKSKGLSNEELRALDTGAIGALDDTLRQLGLVKEEINTIMSINDSSVDKTHFISRLENIIDTGGYLG